MSPHSNLDFSLSSNNWISLGGLSLERIICFPFSLNVLKVWKNSSCTVSFPAIGKEFGKRDHTTVMHAYNKIEKEIKDIPNTKLIVDSLKNILLNDDSF